MRLSTLELLCCPTCHGALSMPDAGNAETIEQGILSCASCQKGYSIEAGIPHFIRREELTGLNRHFARQYDWFSYVYAPFTKIGGLLLGGEEHFRREILDRLEPRGGRLLEVSIGPGSNLPYLAVRPGISEIFGLDISLGQLKRCQGYCRRHRWTVDLFLGAAEGLPFKNETFDSVLHIGGINFFSDKKKAIEEMIRVAKPGTKIVIADETERGAKGYEWIFPTFSRQFEGKREAVTPPVGLVPGAMQDVRLETVWRGWGYCLEFRKP
jgi:ubiquinone/menaquinone biosynthesis C-methylase UbiE